MKDWFKYFWESAVALAVLGAMIFFTYMAIGALAGEMPKYWILVYIGFLLLSTPTWVWLRTKGPLQG